MWLPCDPTSVFDPRAATRGRPCIYDSVEMIGHDNVFIFKSKDALRRS